MDNKYRLSMMIVLIIMLFLYMLGVVEITDASNFSFTLAALIFSVALAVDTFAETNKIAEIISFVLQMMALLVVVLIPNLKDFSFLKKIMDVLDTNVLLILALFFTFAGQWAAEIKIKDIKNRGGK
ncbi:hypothetical protein C805_03052 [Eubacterium sp. 14-2]|uniref:hypothetical protein n=1 Tax=Eubacterium sp. 14-2 TaxID=1235790 RepID=UPI00033B5569|nr:hypothetical protein [Eubacterium sp. 14-2]EOT23391.1 hypothetical protein C805_03052 [Eubacterium sp. 14-2]